MATSAVKQAKRIACEPVDSGNPDMMQAFQGLRRSSAAQPHRNLKRYRRTLKHRSAGWPEQA
jgi:hypothetical protein